MEYAGIRDFCHICSRWGPCYHTIYRQELRTNDKAGKPYPEAIFEAQDTARAVHYAPTPAPASLARAKPEPKKPTQAKAVHYKPAPAPLRPDDRRLLPKLPRPPARTKPKPEEPTQALIEQWDQCYPRVNRVKTRGTARLQNLMFVEARYQSQIQIHAELFCNRLIEKRWPLKNFSEMQYSIFSRTKTIEQRGWDL